MKLLKLEKVQRLPIGIDKAWDFFSSPANLSEITPPDMGFTVTSDVPKEMYAGLIITYKVKPIFNISVNWVTEITQVNKPYHFIDEQRFGPYKLWHHSHFFKEIDGGVEMKDLVWYGLPMGFLGRLFEPIMVKPRLEHIFNFRFEVLDKKFGKYEK